MLVIQTDYDLLEEHLTLLIVKDRQSGATLAYNCEVKGPGDDWVVKQLAQDLEVWGQNGHLLNVRRRAGDDRVAAGIGQGAAGLQDDDAQLAAIHLSAQCVG